MKNSLHRNALVGGIVWLALIAWPLNPNLGIGIIEKLFLLAPLVFVPLGLAVTGLRDEDGGLRKWLVRLQPFGAGGLLVSFLSPLGWTAGLLVGPWLLMIVLAALDGLNRLRAKWRPDEFCFAAALLSLPVGGIGLLQSRLGMSPLGFREPLVLLVAVHFHYAAFVAPIVVGRGLRDEDGGLSWLLAILVSIGSPVLATGYVSGVRGIRLTGALMLVAALIWTSILIARQLRVIRPRLAQVCLAVAALSVWVAMTYASVYAVADYYGEVWVAIPQMARTHGVINACGFSLGGLLGWTLVNAENTEREIL